MAFEIRLSRASDAEGCLAVYAPYVLSSAVSFETKPPSVEEFRRRIESISAQYPYIVCLEAGRVIGYAYAHRHKERAAYQWNAELSVYLDGAYRRRGLGRALYGALMEILRLMNVKNVYALVTSPNPASEALHEAMGFRRAGVLSKTGYKMGAWHDVIAFERAIGAVDRAPEPFIPLPCLDPRGVERALNACRRAVNAR